MASSRRPPHVIAFPFPTQGHVNPMMLLVNHLLAAGIKVTFIHTARTFAMLQEKQSREHGNSSQDDNRSSSSSFYDELLRFEVLPDAAAAYGQGNLPVSPSVRCFMASIPIMREKLEELLRRLLSGSDDGSRPCCIISDNFLPWTQDVADKFGIPRMEFWSSTVTVYAMAHYGPVLISEGYLPVSPDADQETLIDIIPGLGPFRLADYMYDLLHHPIASPIFQFLLEAFARPKEAQRVIVHSFYELEKSVVDALRAEGLPIDPIGPLLPVNQGNINKAPHKKLTSTSFLDEDTGCLEWLDLQPNASVIYASFGSHTGISAEEIQELALGLEDSQIPFLLVIRPDLLVGGSITNVLPEGFQTRTKGTGYIATWAPQLAVLAHPAVGGFLSHCGWNSIVEAMWMGVPIIGCPRESEQNSNLKCLREWNVAISLDTKNGRVQVKRDLVMKAVRTLMQGEEGQLVKRKMLELKRAARQSIERGQSRANLEKLCADIVQMSSGKRPNFL